MQPPFQSGALAYSIFIWHINLEETRTLFLRARSLEYQKTTAKNGLKKAGVNADTVR